MGSIQPDETPISARDTRNFEVLNHPQKKCVDTNLKQHDISLSLDIPAFNPTSPAVNFSPETTSHMLTTHATFAATLHPTLAGNDSLKIRSEAEVAAVRLFFPAVSDTNTLLVFTAWLAFACAMNDLLETMSSNDVQEVLRDCIVVIRSGGVQRTSVKGLGKSDTMADMRVQLLTRSLFVYCTVFLSPSAATAFFDAVCMVFQAHVAEARYLSGPQPHGSFDEYCAIRRRTIALDPFFEVIKADLLTDDERESYHPAWESLQTHVCLAAGLQKDLIGLEKDLLQGEEMNGVLVLLKNEKGFGADNSKKDRLANCCRVVNEHYNRAVADSMAAFERLKLLADVPGFSSGEIVTVAKHIITLVRTHLEWCAGAKRYRTEDKSAMDN